MSGETGDITGILSSWESNESPDVLKALIPLVYNELRKLAMARSSNSTTLQPTALIGELYLKLLGKQGLKCHNRAHFYGMAGRMMRDIMVDHYRKRSAARRGGDAIAATLETGDAAMGEGLGAVDLLALDQALSLLEQHDPLQGSVVTLKFFAGLDQEETSQVLNITPRTVRRKWTAARIWLFHFLREPQMAGAL